MATHNQSTVDSLLNKYAKVTSFSAANYTGDYIKLTWKMTLNISIPSSFPLRTRMPLNGRYINFIKDLAKSKKVIVSLYGEGKSLASFDAITAPIIWCSANNAEAAGIVPQIIFGGIAATGKLTKSLFPEIHTGFGIYECRYPFEIYRS